MESSELKLDIENYDEIISHFIYVLLKKIESDQLFIDKHSKNYIKKKIDTVTESKKNDNLEFMAKLVQYPESRQSFKALIGLGLDSYKELSSRKKDFFNEPIIGEETDYNDDEINQLDELNATKHLGEEYTEDQLNEYKQQQKRQREEDRLAQTEQDIMPDDDGAFDDEGEDF